MPKHPRIVAGVVSTSALLLLGLPAAAEEQAATAPTDEAAPAPDDCGVEPEAGGTEPEAEEPPAPDADGDGMPDAEDDDADGDGEPDAAPTDDDVDGDGLPDAEDDDADGDGEPDAAPQTDDDVDGDGTPDAEDDDADGDGEPDADGTEGDDAPAADDAEADGAEADHAEGDATAGTAEPEDAEASGTEADGAAPAGGCEVEAGEPAPAAAAEPEAEGHEGHAPGAPVDVPPPPAEEAVDPVPPSLDEVPADVLAEIAAYPRTPAGSTADLVEALRPLADAGLGADEIAAVGFGRFPVGGEATWIHDWLFPRYVPTFHTHKGIDIFADRGTPVRAPADGTAHVSNGSIGGLAVKVVEADGTYWYMSHLDAVVAGIDGTRVAAGTVVGTVGDSGNAKGGSPHVHLQLHPQGGDPVDPKPVIDQLAAEALAGVPTVLAEHSGPSVVFSGFTWEPASAVERRQPERDPILDLLLPFARLADEPEHDHDHEAEDESGHGPEDE